MNQLPTPKRTRASSVHERARWLAAGRCAPQTSTPNPPLEPIPNLQRGSERSPSAALVSDHGCHDADQFGALGDDGVVLRAQKPAPSQDAEPEPRLFQFAKHDSL